MIKPTEEQREQISLFIDIMNNHLDSVILHPIVDKKTGVERLGICIADKSEGIIRLLGLWFLPDDNFYDRFEFKNVSSDSEILTERPPPAWKRIWLKAKNKILLLWN